MGRRGKGTQDQTKTAKISVLSVEPTGENGSIPLWARLHLHRLDGGEAREESCPSGNEGRPYPYRNTLAVAPRCNGMPGTGRALDAYCDVCQDVRVHDLMDPGSCKCRECGHIALLMTPLD